MRVFCLTALMLSVPLGLGLGCGDGYESCSETRTCPSGDGDGDLGGSSSGGTGGGGTGDGDGDGDTGGTGTGGTPITTCEDLACEGTTSHCDEESPECVQCLENEHCEADAPVCEGGECTGCSEHADCAEHPDAPVCDDASGACVECLTEDDCGGNVCAPQTRACTNLEAGALFACEPCTHDAECQTGQLCAPQYYGTPSALVGNFCTWTREARVGAEGSCASNGKPFALNTVEPVTSTDGTSAVLCVLRSTTCLAFLQHSQVVDGCTAPGVQDSACGAPDLDDGLCRLNNDTEPRCTYPCGGPEDCSGSFTCIGAPDGYCSL